MKPLGEALGFLAIVVGFILFQQNDRRKILRLKLVCDALWATHFGLLGALSGMAISMVAALREITFSRVRKDGQKKGRLWLLLFLSINILSVVLSWNSPWSLCSLISGLLATTAFWQSSPNRIKVLSLIVCASQITYAIAMRSYAAGINELITVTSILLFFIRTANVSKNAKKKEHKTEEQA